MAPPKCYRCHKFISNPGDFAQDMKYDKIDVLNSRTLSKNEKIENWLPVYHLKCMKAAIEGRRATLKFHGIDLDEWEQSNQ